MKMNTIIVIIIYAVVVFLATRTHLKSSSLFSASHHVIVFCTGVTSMFTETLTLLWLHTYESTNQ